MKHSLLSTIEDSILNHFHIDKEVVSAILDFFSNLSKDDFLYPPELSRRFSLDLKQVYKFLFNLEKNDILQSRYELYCSHCQQSMGIVKFFNELPDFFECQVCHKNLPTLENAIVIYVVVC